MMKESQDKPECELEEKRRDCVSNVEKIQLSPNVMDVKKESEIGEKLKNGISPAKREFQIPLSVSPSQRINIELWDGRKWVEAPNPLPKGMYTVRVR